MSTALGQSVIQTQGSLIGVVSGELNEIWYPTCIQSEAIAST